VTATLPKPEATVRASAVGGLWSRISPKHLIAGLITLILVVGELKFGVLGGYERLVVALGGAMLCEAIFSRFMLGRWPVSLLSAYISGNSLALLLKPQSGLIWPFAMGAAISIGSKYVLRFRGRHLWNPTNFGVSILLLLAAPKLAILSHEWGNALYTNLVIWGIGLLVVARAHLLHVTVTYALSFCAFAALRSAISGAPYVTEIAPLTGPMYQLFVFFMITDPATSLSARRARILVAVIIAVVEAGLRSANDLGMAWAAPFAPAPAFYALFTVGPVALIIQQLRKAPPEPAPAPAR
jgi:Na+-transporting NADH:ubiquinone oxidoreductase subunit NqrB